MQTIIKDLNDDNESFQDIKEALAVLVKEAYYTMQKVEAASHTEKDFPNYDTDDAQLRTFNVFIAVTTNLYINLFFKMVDFDQLVQPSDLTVFYEDTMGLFHKTVNDIFSNYVKSRFNGQYN
jgi:hypothetical protein